MTLLSDLFLFFLQDVKAYNDEKSVDFDLILSEENMLAARQEGFLKKFKLTTTIATSNMHLFDKKGVIKKYVTPEQSKKRSNLFSFCFLFSSLEYILMLHLTLQSLKSSLTSGLNTMRRERLEKLKL